MDFDISQLVPILGQVTGLAPSSLLLYVGILVTVANITGRLIPDDKTGFLGGVRKVAKVVGVYASNRVTSGVSANDVVRAVVGAGIHQQAENIVQDMASEAGSLIPGVIGDVAESAAAVAFPGFQARQGLMSEPTPDPVATIEKAKADMATPPARKRSAPKKKV